MSRVAPFIGAWLALVSVSVAGAPAGAAQDGKEKDRPITGFSGDGARTEARFEQALLEIIRPDSIERWARGLAARPHVAGTPAQAITRDSVLAWNRAAGLSAGYDSLSLYLPQPIHVSLDRTYPSPVSLPLAEPPLENDPATQSGAVPVFNAYSGSGAVEAEVVFANYGLPSDYRTLDSLGVSVAGRVVLARYGRSFRGIKAREAEGRGAAALLLYSDPASDGFVKGQVYPEGPMRPPRGVQRGSILNTKGDPSTPEGPSLPAARRVPEAQMTGIARIPVVPIGYGTAEELLRHLRGNQAPASWRGGLDLDYAPGPGPARVRVEVRTERGEEAYHPAFNTIAQLKGAVWPEEWIVIGAHRDAWSAGAIDNVSGTASVVEVARAFAAAAARGHRPRRTVVFATWDAEEWGILGSIEWVEANAARLHRSVVAYVNQDAPVSGSSFGAAASPELKSLMRDVSRQVEEPGGGGSVFDAWMERARARALEPETPTEPPVADLGGGSDHEGFYQHLGIPSVGFGFGGRGGVYHSMYDTPRWMQRFGDPGYRYHAAAARVAAILVARLANAEILPYDHAGLADETAERLHHLELYVEEALHSVSASQHVPGEASLEAADAGTVETIRTALNRAHRATRDLESEAAALAGARDEYLRKGPSRAEVAARVNAALRESSLALTAEAGLPGDPWSRQLLFSSDPDNGYATLPLPAPRLALRAGDLAQTAARIEELVRHLGRARVHLGAARSILEREREGREREGSADP